MFKFLSLFNRKIDEQLNNNNNNNDYDFNEFPVSENDIKGMVENQMPASSSFASAKRPEAYLVSSPSIAAHRQEASDKTGIDRVRETLRAISDNPQSPLGEDRTGLDRQEGESLFDINDKILLGKGGENFVYAIPGDESVVGRVAIGPLIDQLAQTEGQPNTNETTARETLQAALEAENNTYNELCAYFGNEHVPQTTRSVRQIPTSEAFLEAIHKAKRRDMPDVALTPTDLLTIVAIQEKVPEINDDKSRDVQGGFAERRNPTVMNTERYKQAYESATQALICDPESASFDLDQFLIIHPGLRPIVDQADTSPQLKDSLKDFVQKAIHYSQQTRKGLDLFGEKNILFFEDADNNLWNYKLVDASPPSNQEEALERSEGLMKKVIAKETLANDEKNDEKLTLTTAVNYIRTINGLAKHLGIDDHLDLIPHSSTLIPSEFWDILYDGGPPEGSSQKQENKETPSQ